MYDRNKFTFLILTAFAFIFCIFGLGVSASYSATEEDLEKISQTFDVHFESVEVEQENVLFDTPKIAEDSTSMSNINFEFDNMSDSIRYKIVVVNDGTIDGEIAQFLVTNPVCNNQDMCNNLVETLTYENGEEVKRGDILEAHSSVTLYLDYKYVGDTFDNNLTVEKIALSINYMEG